MEPSESMTVLEAVGLYVKSIKTKDNRDEVQKELFRFINWCGQDRPIARISPSEMDEYATQVSGSGTSPRAVGRLQVVRKFLSYARRKGLVATDLARHVRLPKSKSRGGKKQGLQDHELVELTAEGYTQLESRLEKLKLERAPLAQQIRMAAADRDVRENVPLEAAREQLGHVESRIRSIQSTLESAAILDPGSAGRGPNVQLGMRVSVKDLETGRETVHTVVSRSEANPLEGRISDVSPLGQALMGRTVGQEVEATTPRGKIRYRILKVRS